MTQLNNKLLGIIAVITAPFLFIDFIVNGNNGGGENYQHTSLSGLFSLVYMIGWICSIIALKRIYSDAGKAIKILLNLQLIFLAVANCWNIYEIVDPGADTIFYRVTDLFWPGSNVLMLITGITIAVSKSRSSSLRGWQKYTPLFTGLWLPLSIVMALAFGFVRPVMMASGAYSALMWAMMGYVVSRYGERNYYVLAADAG